MKKDSEKTAYVHYRVQKAEETLEVANLLIKNQKWNSAVNRLYYAAFYAVSGLLAKDEINTKTHNGVKTQFFLEYVKTKKIRKELGRVYADLFDWRQKGDYGDFFDFTENDVKSILEPTKELLQAIKGELENDFIIIEQIFNNSIEQVWTAITQLDQMKQWFFDNIEDFKPEIGFETQFDVYNDERLFRHLWKITEVVPMKKIKYNWKYEGYKGDSFVIFELFEENKQVRLKLSCEIIEDFPADIPEFKRESCIGGWNYFIKESLPAFLSR